MWVGGSGFFVVKIGIDWLFVLVVLVLGSCLLILFWNSIFVDWVVRGVGCFLFWLLNFWVFFIFVIICCCIVRLWCCLGCFGWFFVVGGVRCLCFCLSGIVYGFWWLWLVSWWVLGWVCGWWCWWCVGSFWWVCLRGFVLFVWCVIWLVRFRVWLCVGVVLLWFWVVGGCVVGCVVWSGVWVWCYWVWVYCCWVGVWVVLGCVVLDCWVGFWCRWCLGYWVGCFGFLVDCGCCLWVVWFRLFCYVCCWIVWLWWWFCCLGWCSCCLV